MKNRIVKISSFILIGIVLIQFFIIAFNSYNKYKNLKDMEKLNNFSLIIGGLVHSIQEERDMSVNYLENKNIQSKKSYNLSMKSTNINIKKYEEYLKKYNLKFNGFQKDLKEMKNYFKTLKIQREKILNLQISRENSIKFYGKINKKLLSILHVFVREATDTKLVKALMGYLGFQRLKESIGIERTILYVTLLDNKWNHKLYIQYIRTLTRQQVFNFQALMMANNEIRQYFHKVMKKDLLYKIATIQKTVLAKQGNFGINPQYCYKLMTQEINIMKLLDQKYYQRNVMIINSIKSELFFKVLVNLGLSLLIILFVLYNLSSLHKENKSLKNKVIYDTLTHSYTRMFFISEFELFKARADRNQRKIAILFIDLDGFKNINDTLGHDAGDIVLIKVAEIIKTNIRKNDIVSRFGGDEFLVMLDDVKNQQIVENIANKLLVGIKKPIQIKNDIVANVSASIGVSVYPDNGNNIDDLLEFADQNMYKSKKSGKDKVTLS